MNTETLSPDASSQVAAKMVSSAAVGERFSSAQNGSPGVSITAAGEFHSSLPHPNPLPPASGPEREKLLTPDESKELQYCEAIVRKHLKDAVLFAQALGNIRDKRLYRATHGTFEAYCQDKWAMPARSARRAIDQGKVYAHLTSPDIDGATRPPATISLVNPLIALDEIHWRPVWREAVATAVDGEPTVKHVEATVVAYKARMDAGNSQSPIANSQQLKPVIDLKPIDSRDGKIKELLAKLRGNLMELTSLVGTSDCVSGAKLQAVILPLAEYEDHRFNMDQRKKRQAA